MKFNFSVYGSFWDRLMGTCWSPLDERAQEKYMRGKASAETTVDRRKQDMDSGSQSGENVKAEVDAAVGVSTTLEL